MGVRDKLRSLLTFIGILVVLAVLGRIFLFEVVQTDSYSMAPSIIAGDTFLVYKHATVDLGDAVVCRHPEDPSRMVVGRVLATGGMTIELSNDNLLLNGEIIQRQFFEEMTYTDFTSEEEAFDYTMSIGEEAVGGNKFRIGFVDRSGNRNLRERTVSDGFVYLLGDNRNRARDSRHFGEVPIDSCIGQAFLVVWPADDSGDFKKWDRLPDLIE